MGRVAVNPILDTQITCVLSVNSMGVMNYGEGSGQPNSGHTDNLCPECQFYGSNELWGG